MMKAKQVAKKRTTNISSRIGKIMLIAGIGLMMSIGAHAQDGLDGDPDTPFDGGVSLLVAAGVAYGAKQWRDARNKKNDEQNAGL